MHRMTNEAVVTASFYKNGVKTMNRHEKFSRKVGLFAMFAGPSMIAFLLFVIIPFFYGIYLTMTDWDKYDKGICRCTELYRAVPRY